MMDKRTLTALKASIRHWEENVAAETISQVGMGTEACALCRRFNNNTEADQSDCDGCPVAARTGMKYCEGSPYEAALTASERWEWCDEHEYLGMRDEFRAAAQAELDFLKSLLPEDKQP